MVSENDITSSNSQNTIRSLIHTTPELSRENRGMQLQHDIGNKPELPIGSPNKGERAHHAESPRGRGPGVPPAALLLIAFTFQLFGSAHPLPPVA